MIDITLDEIQKLRQLAVAADQPHAGVARDYFRQSVTAPRMLAMLDLVERQLNSFQQRVQPWMLACFGEMIAGDREERNHRFFEEAAELVQACGMSASEAHQLVDYVYGRPVGEPAQEVGGVMVTLAALCLANDMDMHAAGETELARIWTKVEAIRANQAAKPKHSPLPAPPAPATGWRQLSHNEVRTIYRAWQQAEDTPMGLLNRFREAATAPQQHAQAALGEVREAVLTYYDALTARQHGGMAQDKAFNTIQHALGLSWHFGVDHRAAGQQPAAAPARRPNNNDWLIENLFKAMRPLRDVAQQVHSNAIESRCGPVLASPLPEVSEPEWIAFGDAADQLLKNHKPFASDQDRIKSLYEAVSKVISGDYDLNITRLHDYLGCEEGIAADSVLAPIYDAVPAVQAQDERAAFEAWAKSDDGGCWDEDSFSLNESGAYQVIGLRNEWEAFKAGCAALTKGQK